MNEDGDDSDSGSMYTIDGGVLSMEYRTVAPLQRDTYVHALKFMQLYSNAPFFFGLSEFFFGRGECVRIYV